MKKVSLVVGMLTMLTASLPGAAGVSYDNGFVLKSDKGGAHLKLNGRGQHGVSLVENAGAGADGGSDWGLDLDFPEMRLMLGGAAFNNKLSYFAQIDLAGVTGEAASFLKDYWFAYSTDWFDAQAGQFKASFYGSYMTSSGSLALSSRPFYMKGGENAWSSRWLGVSFHNDRDAEWAWNVDVFQGRWAARLAYNNNGLNAYNEYDMAGGDVRWGAALAAGSQLNGIFDGKGFDGANLGNYFGLNLDLMLKWSGLTVAVAFNPELPLNDTKKLAWAGHAQLSYMISDEFAVAARYALDSQYRLMAPATGATAAPTMKAVTGQEILAGVTIFCPKTTFKLQLDGGAMTPNGSSWEAQVNALAQMSF